MKGHYGNSANRNLLKQKLTNLDEKAGSPVNEQLRVSYGYITDVDEETSQVKVKVFGRNQQEDIIIGETEKTPTGVFLPILQPLHLIHFFYGLLRKDLTVRIWWKGKNKPDSDSIIEIIGDDNFELFRTGKKEPEQNVISIGAYRLFGGGLGLD